MKPQVPDILAKFFLKHDPAVHLYEIRTTDLPELETLYRDNTTGIVWKVLAHSGSDLYSRPYTDYATYGLNTSLSKRDNERDRMVILQSVEPEGVTMHIEPSVLKSKIHSSEHYAVTVRATPHIDRFTKLDYLESRNAPFWKRGVRTMDTEKTLRTLAEPGTTSLYVINVYPTPHGLCEFPFEWHGVSGHPEAAKIQATWIPQDLLESVPKEALLKNQAFRRFLDKGFILPITTGSAKRIQGTPEYAAEMERIKGIPSIWENLPHKVKKQFEKQGI